MNQTGATTELKPAIVVPMECHTTPIYLFRFEVYYHEVRGYFIDGSKRLEHVQMVFPLTTGKAVCLRGSHNGLYSGSATTNLSHDYIVVY